MLASACGPIPVKVEGKVEHELNLTSIEKYLRYDCLRENPGADNGVLESCVNVKMADFLEALSKQK